MIINTILQEQYCNRTAERWDELIQGYKKFSIQTEPNKQLFSDSLLPKVYKNKLNRNKSVTLQRIATVIAVAW